MHLGEANETENTHSHPREYGTLNYTDYVILQTTSRATGTRENVSFNNQYTRVEEVVVISVSIPGTPSKIG